MARKKSRKNTASHSSFVQDIFEKVADESRQIREGRRKGSDNSSGISVSLSRKVRVSESEFPICHKHLLMTLIQSANTAGDGAYGKLASQISSNPYGSTLDNVNSQAAYNYRQGYIGYYQQPHQAQNYFTQGSYNYPQQSYNPYGQAGDPSMAYSQWGNSQQTNPQYGYQYPPGYDAYAQQQQYQPTPPQIRNPFAPPPPARSQYTAQNAQHDPEYEAQLAQWQSTYAPPDPYEKGKKGGKGDKGENSNLTNVGFRQGPNQGSAETGGANANGSTDEKKKTVVRKGGGETWEDDTLLEWDPTQFRIMVGNLAGEVTDDSLFKAFAQYGPSKARVVRDKRTTKSKGFGFVAFTDGELGFKAAREMTGKYIGSHPVTIERAKTDVRPVTKKDKNKHKNKDKGGKGDQLRANTGAHIEKKPVKNPSGYKILG